MCISHMMQQGSKSKVWGIQFSYESVISEDDENICFYGEQIQIWSFWCSLPTICKHIHKSFPFHFLHLYHTPISLVIKAYSQVIPVCPASPSLLHPVSITGERFLLSVNWINSLSLLIYWTCPSATAQLFLTFSTASLYFTHSLSILSWLVLSI